jgi:hypothetical protein
MWCWIESELVQSDLNEAVLMRYRNASCNAHFHAKRLRRERMRKGMRVAHTQHYFTFNIPTRSTTSIWWNLVSHLR